MKLAAVFDLPYILLFLVGLGMASAFPFFAYALVGFLIASLARDGRVGAWCAFLTATGLFAWLNANKVVAGDWDWYTHHYYVMHRMDLLPYFESTYSGVQARLSEPFYHLLAYFLANLTSSNVDVLAVVVTVIIYGVAAVASARIAALYSLRSRDTYFVVLGTLFLGVTFSLTTQLVRQQIAISVLALCVVLLVFGYLRISLFFAVLCLGTHNSSVFPLLAFYLVYVVIRAFPKRAFLSIAILSLLFFSFGSAFTAISGEYGAYNFVGKDDGSVSLITFVYDACLVAGLMVLWFLREESRWLCKYLFCAFLVYLSFVVGTFSDPLAFLRMYFYVEAFRILIVSVVLVGLVRLSRGSLLVGGGSVFLGLVYCYARIESSPFDFKGNVFDYVFYSPF